MIVMDRPQCAHCGCSHLIPINRRAKFKNTAKVLVCRHCGRKWHEPLIDKIKTSRRRRKRRDELNDF